MVLSFKIRIVYKIIMTILEEKICSISAIKIRKNLSKWGDTALGQ